MTKSIVGGFVVREKYCSLAKKVWLISQANRAQVITQLTLHTCNRSIKPNLVLIFSTLVTWLHVMSHMQWARSIITCMSFATYPSHFTSMSWVAQLSVPVDQSPMYLIFKHISPPRLSLNYQNQIRAFHGQIAYPGDKVQMVKLMMYFRSSRFT